MAVKVVCLDIGFSDETCTDIANNLPEAVAFQKALTGREVMTFYARLKGANRNRSLDLLDRVGLSDAANRKVGAYSKGMRQRLGLAQALIGHPKLVLLDEPTSGLDPVSRQNFYELIEEVAAEGATVLLSSHALTEVEAKTDRILILSKGQLVADDTLSALRARARLPIRIRVRGSEDAADRIAERLGGTRVNGRSVDLFCEPEGKVACLASIGELGGLVDDVDMHLPSLDDVYRHFSGITAGEV